MQVTQYVEAEWCSSELGEAVRWRETNRGYAIMSFCRYRDRECSACNSNGTCIYQMCPHLMAELYRLEDKEKELTESATSTIMDK